MGGPKWAEAGILAPPHVAPKPRPSLAVVVQSGNGGLNVAIKATTSGRMAGPRQKKVLQGSRGSQPDQAGTNLTMPAAGMG